MAHDRLRLRPPMQVLLLAATALSSCGDTTSGIDADTGLGYQDPFAHEIINGTCAPEGETFTSVYSCETVEGGTSNVLTGAVSKVEHNPATLEDPDYEWVAEQLSACSCTCCHTNNGTGTNIWSSTFEPAWTDSADSDLLDSLLRPLPSAPIAEENNGFSTDSTYHPTTNPERFGAFIERELARRNP